MILMIHRLERKSVTDKFPLAVGSHVRGRNIIKGVTSKVLVIRLKAGRDYCGRLKGVRHQYY